MKRAFLFFIGFFVFVVLVPVGINYAFKLPAGCTLFEAEWEAGDLLGYYGSVLGGIVSFVVLYFTLKKERDQMIEAEIKSKRTYLDIWLDIESRADLRNRKSLPYGTRIYILEKNTEAMIGEKKAIFLELSNNSKECVHDVNVNIEYENNGMTASMVNIAQMRSNETLLILLPDRVSVHRLPHFSESVEMSPDNVRIDRVTVLYRTAASETMKAELLFKARQLRYYATSNGKDKALFIGQMVDEWYRFEA